jgi:magnesium chelatase family protein
VRPFQAVADRVRSPGHQDQGAAGAPRRVRRAGIRAGRADEPGQPGRAARLVGPVRRPAPPPFLAPHHTSSKAAITGGGTGSIRPGAASLAHRGVLFLDQAPEFDRDVLDALRQPLESGQITVARSGITAIFPARFILVLGATPCPCAATASPAEKCTCSPATRKRYLGRISGPLLDRVDVKINLIPAGHQESQNDRGAAEPSTAAAVRVAAARDRAAHRLKATPWQVNAEVPGSELRRHWPPAPGALTMIHSALDRGLISERGAVKVVRVAWTIADLAGTGTPQSARGNSGLSSAIVILDRRRFGRLG